MLLTKVVSYASMIKIILFESSLQDKQFCAKKFKYFLGYGKRKRLTVSPFFDYCSVVGKIIGEISTLKSASLKLSNDKP